MRITYAIVLVDGEGQPIAVTPLPPTIGARPGTARYRKEIEQILERTITKYAEAYDNCDWIIVPYAE